MNPAAFRRLAAVEDRHWWYLGMRATARRLLESSAPGGDLLDAGCGTGGWLQTLAGWDAFGVDRHPAALALARRRVPGRIARATVTALPFADASFDVVTAVDVLYHEAVVSDVAALAELGRVVRPGGAVLVQVPAYDWLRSRHDRDVATRERYTSRRLADRVAAAGLRVDRVTHANALLLPLAVAWRTLEGRLPGTSALDLWVPPEPLNSFALGLLAIERWWLRRHRLPWGLSVLAVARRGKPATTRTPAVPPATRGSHRHRHGEAI
ncbi:MAG: class I SAM-dependent methyltransferase [Anaerolineae bacterium]